MTSESIAATLSRKIQSMENFPANGTFGAISDARKAVKGQGFIAGSMCMSHPIALMDRDRYGFVAKWKNLTTKERSQVDGVIISNDFREGAVQVVLFEAVSK